MQLGNDYKIESDSLNVTLSKRVIIEGKKGKKTDRVGETNWINIGYYSNFENALHDLVDYRAMTTKLDDLKTIVKEIRQAKQDITQALKGYQDSTNKQQTASRSKDDKSINREKVTA